MVRTNSTILLVVEDYQPFREALTLLLTTLGYVVEAAANGLEALGRLESGLRPCLILLDLAMPIMDGRQFLEAWRQYPEAATVPIVLMTSLDPDPYAASLGAADCLNKPFDADTLLQMIRRHCGQRG